MSGPVPLSWRELYLLAALRGAGGAALRKPAAVEAVWGPARLSRGALYALVHCLRAKLGPILHVEPGAGVRLVGAVPAWALALLVELDLDDARTDPTPPTEPARAAPAARSASARPRRTPRPKPAHLARRPCYPGPACGACHGCKIAASVRATVRAGRARPDWRRWSREQDDFLRARLGRVPPAELARRLTERFSVPRTEKAVYCRAKKLGLSLVGDGWSATALADALAVAPPTVGRWVEEGRLVGRRFGRKSLARWRFARPDVERFLREHPDAYEWEAIVEPSLRAVGEVVARRRRVVSVAVAARQLPVSEATVRLWAAEGAIPGVTIARHVRGGRAGAAWAYRIPAAALPLLRRMAARHVRAAQLAAVERMRAARAQRRRGIAS